jgi:hypothetical protein
MAQCAETKRRLVQKARTWLYECMMQVPRVSTQIPGRLLSSPVMKRREEVVLHRGMTRHSISSRMQNSML